MKASRYDTRINVPDIGIVDAEVERHYASIQDGQGGFVDGWHARVTISAHAAKTPDEAKKRLAALLRTALDKIESGE